MDRRRFLTLLGLAPLVPYVPKKAYSFLGGIFRPRGVDSGYGFMWTPESAPLTLVDWVKLHRMCNPPLISEMITSGPLDIRPGVCPDWSTL